MNEKLLHLKAFLLGGILLTLMFAGCVEEGKKIGKIEDVITTEVHLNQPSVLPDWKDGKYHDYHGTIQMLNDFNDKYPKLVDVFSIGKSVLGKDILCIKITNEDNNESKLSGLIDGCIHGNEWESSEACLYLSEYLLINFGNNETINNILNRTEIYIVPLVNPDGRQKDQRWNENGVDLNRNFDIHFGRLRGRSLRMGRLLGQKIPFVYIPNIVLLTNSGKQAFSEPETQAIHNLMMSLKYRGFSFYMNCHTAQHKIISPWIVFKPPFKITPQERNVLDYVERWVDTNTEYESTRVENKHKVFYTSGTAMDWCYKEFHIPSFIFKMLSKDYEPFMGKGRHDNLVHWMKTTLPVFMYLLVNIENLHQWKIPDVQPPLLQDDFQ
ncbi:MAG: hypothetical protein DRO67_10135 [Candidatus Asgardarchaeum californiense]|nr:MAG: hypothetical protein DRO67_10135 [Candidatus Asgardarchaeum californiense]